MPGVESARLNEAVGARAFTLGSDIYLGEGETGVDSDPGRRLLAHELAHVVQQTGSTPPADGPVRRSCAACASGGSPCASCSGSAPASPGTADIEEGVILAG